MKRKKTRIKIWYSAYRDQFYGRGQKKWFNLLWLPDTERVSGLTSLDSRRRVEWIYEERQRIKNVPREKLKPRYEYLDQ